MSIRVHPSWGTELNQFEQHHSLESCSDYLPKAKGKLAGLVVQCSKCGQLYVGAKVPLTGTPFWKIALIKGEQK